MNKGVIFNLSWPIMYGWIWHVIRGNIIRKCVACKSGVALILFYVQGAM